MTSTMLSSWLLMYISYLATTSKNVLNKLPPRPIPLEKQLAEHKGDREYVGCMTFFNHYGKFSDSA